MPRVLLYFLSIFAISIIIIPVTSVYFENSLNRNYFQSTRRKLFNISTDMMGFRNDKKWFVSVKKKLENATKEVVELPVHMFVKKKVSSPNTFFYKNQLDETLHSFFIYTDRIGGMYKHYKEYSESGLADKTYHETVMKEFVNVVVSHRVGSLTDTMEQIYRLFVPSQINPHTYKPIRLGLFDLLVLRQKSSHPTELCHIKDSFFHQINEIYAILCHVEILSYIINEKYLNMTQLVLSNASREIVRCDPPQHIRDKTYIELTHLFQKFFINEIQAYPTETCSSSCEDISSNGIYRCYSWSPLRTKAMYCHNRDCRGKINKCSWIGTSTLCELPGNNPRRVQWIRSQNGWYGPKESCLGTRKRVENSITGLYNCDNCICHCTEDDPDATSMRFLSLMPQMSNISDNRVVTGIKFVQKNNMIHIQIEHGQLMAEGEINNKTFKWVDLGDFVYKPNVSEGFFYKLEENIEIPLVKGKDYTLIGSKQRSLFLDDITVPNDMVVTGVRLIHVEQSSGLNTSPLQLEILATSYDYETGVLSGDEARWITSETMPYPSIYYERDRRELVLSRPDNPTKYYSHIPQEETNLFVKFRASDIWKDAAQTVVPLFDAQAVTTLIRPLGGVGITHKSVDDSGGFIAMKLFT
ncbi:Protein of unknown function, partial [Cotesia congregata]